MGYTESEFQIGDIVEAKAVIEDDAKTFYGVVTGISHHHLYVLTLDGKLVHPYKIDVASYNPPQKLKTQFRNLSMLAHVRMDWYDEGVLRPHCVFVYLIKNIMTTKALTSDRIKSPEQAKAIVERRCKQLYHNFQASFYIYR